jgi:hypothetical protein
MRIWKRNRIGLLAIMLAIAPMAGAQTPITPTTEETKPRTPFLGGFLKETRVVYPLRIGKWEAQGEHRYEQQELGASVRYMHAEQKNRWIDLYFYPAGVLPESRLASDVESTLEEIRLSAGGAGGYSEVDIAAAVPITFQAGEGKQKRKIDARSASMRLVRDGTAYNSAMVMLILDLYYVKGRFSVEEKALSRESTQKQLEKFMAGVVRDSEVRSTGDCWMPAPIVEKSALVADAPGELIKINKEGALSAVAYADRIEALDAQSPEARVMQFLSMPMSGRLFEGCVPIESINPEVPADMRELRLEFNVPSNQGNPSVPLRQGNTGVS